MRLTYIKIFAVFSMLFDHIYLSLVAKKTIEASGYLLFIGRFAIPIFIILLAYNYIFNTQNKFLYISRLILVGLLSEIPYYLYFGKHFNFMLALGVALLIHFLLESAKNKLAINFVRSRVLQWLATIGACVSVLLFFKNAFSVFIILFPLLAYFKRKQQFNCERTDVVLFTLSGVLLAVLFGATLFPVEIISATVISMLIIFPLPYNMPARLVEPRNYFLFRSRKQFLFYIFYPAHLLMLFFIFGKI